jgi:hypothetical protein
MRGVRLLGPILFFGALAGVLLSRAGSPPPAQAQTADLTGPALAIAATPHDPEARRSDLRLVVPRALGNRVQLLGAISHARGAVLRGDVLPDKAVVVAADAEGGREPDFGAVLWRVDASGPPRRLADGLYHASRPLASADGSVYVERGAPGAWPTPEEARSGRLRTDDLRIDAVDPESGAARTLFAWRGYTLHIAGEWENELLVYRVAFDGAEVVGIDRGSARVRSIAVLPPFARDFSVDTSRSALLFSERDARDPHLWTVEALDLRGGARTGLAAASDDAPAPFALPDRSIAWSAPGRRGLWISSLQGGKATLLRSLAPLGPGFDAVTHASNGGEWVTILHIEAGAFDVALALHLPSATPIPLGRRDERVEVLGIWGAAGVSAR